MKSKWQHSLSALLLGLSLSVPLTGCFAHPVPRPEMADPASPQVHAQVAATAARVPGAGQTAAVVLGDVALVAIQLNAEVPGGTNGSGGPALLTGGTVPPPPATSSSGTTPIDVMNRVADQIRTEHRYIREVRVLNIPVDTVRLGRISRELVSGRSISEFRPEIDSLFHAGVNLGTTHTPPFPPAQGTDTPTKRR